MHYFFLQLLYGTFLVDSGDPCGHQQYYHHCIPVVKILIWLACAFDLRASKGERQHIFNTIVHFQTAVCRITGDEIMYLFVAC